MKTTKRALLTSVMALILCFSMLVGTTFAWFTDEVKSGVNQIVAGNLDVNLYHSDDNAKDQPVAGDTKLFDDVDPNLWEPGALAYEILTVANEGTLALKYQLAINFENATVVNGHSLVEALKVAVVDATDLTSREAAIKAAAGKWQELKSFVLPGELAAEKSETYGIVIYWEPTENDNWFNLNKGETEVLSIDLGVHLFATQLDANIEQDSFGPDYDEDAWHPAMKVYSAQDLQAAINNGETNIVLMDDIDATEPIVIPAAPTTYSLRTNAVVINLNGKTIKGTGLDAEGKRAHVIVNNGSAVITGGNIEVTGTNGGSAICNNGTLTVENMSILGAPWGQDNTAWPSYAINSYGDITINASKIVGTHGAVAINEGSKGVINSGDISITGCKLLSDHVLYAPGTSALTIKGGNFEMAYDNTVGGDTLFSGNFVVTGGIFNEDPSAYVATGYKVVESNSNYVVVPESVDAAVSTPVELATELQEAAAAGAGDSTIVLTGDIDMTGTTWTPISVDGYHGAGVVTIEGNGATIKGLNAPLFAGGFAGKSGIVIKNLTIADSNIVGGNQGGGAFIDCADSMHVITLDNCHLVNSTVSGERTGGLIGWCSGYAKLDDGPVKAYVTITNCSVVDSTVIGNGSAGGIAGHPGASDYTYTTIENCVVKNVDVVSYEPVSSWRTGAIVGTANNGHVVINNVTVENVTLTQDGVTATETKLFGRFVPSGTGTLVIDGAEVVATTEALKEALSAETESIAVILANDISIDIGTGWKMGGANTESITIDGNGKVLTLSSTYRSYFNLVNAEGVLNLKNMTLTNTHKGTHFFDYTTHFNCDVVAENVVFAKSPLVSDGATAVFNDCAFSQAGTDIYGLWIMSGTNVTVNGGELTTDRGFKIADEDSAKELTTLKVSGTKFNNTKKAAILVTTNYGAEITLSNVDITNCDVDSTNAVWIDDGRTATADKIVVTGGSVVIEP